MSAFGRDLMDALRWLLKLPAGQVGKPTVFPERAPLEPSGAPSMLLPYGHAMFLELAPGQLAEGTVYGRPFRIELPPREYQPRMHRWGAYTWHGTHSGTGRTEIKSGCATCSERVGWVVNPEACAASRLDPAVAGLLPQDPESPWTAGEPTGWVKMSSERVDPNTRAGEYDWHESDPYEGGGTDGYYWHWPHR